MLDGLNSGNPRLGVQRVRGKQRAQMEASQQAALHSDQIHINGKLPGEACSGPHACACQGAGGGGAVHSEVQPALPVRAQGDYRASDTAGIPIDRHPRITGVS